MAKQTVLITGGAGFIGSNIASELLARDYNVKVLDNLSTGRLINLDSIKDKIKFIEGDINDTKLLQQEFADVDFVLHQAALPSVPRSIESPMDSHFNNATGILNILQAARDAKVKRVVYASSSSVYGDAKEEYKSEDLQNDPLSPYAIAKLMGEYYCKVFYNLYGLETVSLRYFNVFGPNQDPQSDYAAVIPLFIKAILKDESPTIFGDGEHSRDFTFVKNNVEANILAMHSDKAGHGEAINIACGKAYTLNELVATINKILGKNITSKFSEPRQGDIKHSLADISKATELLGYQPGIDFEGGLRQTITWIKDNA
ncbi:SDR family oxidoreductase [Candidatus Parcubacteria bacterium]|jgi:nucleoside-diphosphate-sugar epimerase|nr:SDR family oxidoreductase [Candidatus Parcubacteria bacterium]